MSETTKIVETLTPHSTVDRGDIQGDANLDIGELHMLRVTWVIDDSSPQPVVHRAEDFPGPALKGVPNMDIIQQT